MTATILITGFGPFPGAPFNPTEPLVDELARRRHPALAGVRRVAHVFRVSYEAVDRELPELLAREQPDVLVMFGLAARTPHIRIETRARNALARMAVRMPAATGRSPVPSCRTRAATLALPRAGAAAAHGGAIDRRAGRALARRRPLSLQLSVLAGGGGPARPDRPRVAAFIHVPRVTAPRPLARGGAARRSPSTI